MNKFTRLIALLLIAMAILTSCYAPEPLIVKESETCIVFKVGEDAKDITLIEYMESLQEKSEIQYTIKNGMVTSINGIENPKDFSSCWMLYTSDEDNANPAFGTVEYDGKIYNSAAVGANELKIKAGHVYIWVFKAFEG